jgi:hypothetical protein
MQKHMFLGALLVALAAAGCAGADTQDEPLHSRPEATTGSNIPRKARTADAPKPQSVAPQASGATH